MGNARRNLILLLAVASSFACTGKTPTGPSLAAVGAASAASAPAGGRPSAPRALAPRQAASDGLIGTWGGEHVRLTIGRASSLLEYDCAHGSIDQPFTVDAGGRFDLAGVHVVETPGPVREGADPVQHPARYTGSTDGKTLTFTLMLTDSNQTFGPFTLTLNAPGRVVKCL